MIINIRTLGEAVFNGELLCLGRTYVACFQWLRVYMRLFSMVNYYVWEEHMLRVHLVSIKVMQGIKIYLIFQSLGGGGAIKYSFYQHVSMYF